MQTTHTAADVSAGSVARVRDRVAALRQRIKWNKVTPYLLVLPAIVFELLVHVIPMLVGVWMSFIKLTQFYITNWLQAPWMGLRNFQVALDFSKPLGAQLVRSFGITLAFAVLTVGFAFIIGTSASIVLHGLHRVAEVLSGTRGDPNTLLGALRTPCICRHHHLEVHAAA